MHKRFSKFAVFLICLSILSLSFSGQPVIAEKADHSGSTTRHTLAVSETGIYIVRLQDASLASYKGGTSSLAATSPEVTGARRLDTRTAESQAYLNYLGNKQVELLNQMAHAFGRPVEAIYQYKNVLNAIAVKLEYSEALRLFNLPEVSAVYPDRIYQLDTDAGPTLIGAPAIWEGYTLNGDSTYGEGMVIGLLDSGINHAHPSFADVGGDAYDHTNPNGTGIYFGYCIDNPSFCNDKLIGAYDLTYPGSGGPEDEDGHGSHTASTAAGNFLELEISDGTGGSFPVQISGVAPYANLVAYRVCDDDGGCQTAASVAAVDHAIADGVDVLNYSISGADDPWNDAVDLAFLDAYAAGIFVSASAGNAGPGAGTVAKTGPWNAAVAASTHSRYVANPVDVVTDAASLTGLGATEGTGPALTENLTAPLIYGGDIDSSNVLGCSPWTGTPFAGAIGMVQRGDCNFSVKVQNLTDAGAVGALVYNNVAGPPIVMAGLEETTIPSMMITLGDGLQVVSIISPNVPATITMYSGLAFYYDDSFADVLAGFSSRGPSQWELMKPDYAAPGVNILAAVAADPGDPEQYGFYSGTSMAAPHGAGSAALLMALHPDWSPAEIKSAISMTASNTLLKEDGVTPATPLDGGSGRIDLVAAAYAGLVMNETTENYIAANPYLGGEPNSLNQPSMVEYDCIGSCSWSRTFSSTLPNRQHWRVSYTSFSPGLTLPGTTIFNNIDPGESFTVQTTATTDATYIDQFLFGEMVLTPLNPPAIPVIRLPIVVYFTMSNLPNQLNITTDQLAGTETVEDTQALVAIESLAVDIAGLAPGKIHNFSLPQDPTNGDPFDNLNDVFWTTVAVQPNSLRLVAELVESDAPDLDLFVGTGTTPSAATIVCTSATGVWDEYCNIENPAMGYWWVLVQNWQGSGADQDAIRAITAVVAGDEENLTITAPTSVPAQQLFDLGVNWDEPGMEYLSNYWYAQFALGTRQSEAGNLGYTNVNLVYIGDFYRVELVPATQDGYGDPGDVISYTLTLTNLGNIADSYALSLAEDLWEAELTETSVELDPGESQDIHVSVTIPTDALPGTLDSLGVTATSDTHPQVTTEAVINSHSIADYGFDLTPATLAGSADPGEVVTYELTLTNLGNAENTITLVPGAFLWGVNIPVSSFDIPVGESVDVIVEITVPEDAEVGTTDTVTITATSEGGMQKTSVLSTTAGPVTHSIWMPLISMPEG